MLEAEGRKPSPNDPRPLTFQSALDRQLFVILGKLERLRIVGLTT